MDSNNYPVMRYKDEFFVMVERKPLLGSVKRVFYILGIGFDKSAVMFRYPMIPKGYAIERDMRPVGYANKHEVNSYIDSMYTINSLGLRLNTLQESQNIKTDLQTPFDSKYFMPNTFDHEVMEYLSNLLPELNAELQEHIKTDVLPKFKKPYDERNPCMRIGSHALRIFSARSLDIMDVVNIIIENKEDPKEYYSCRSEDLMKTFGFSSDFEANNFIHELRLRFDLDYLRQCCNNGIERNIHEHGAAFDYIRIHYPLLVKDANVRLFAQHSMVEAMRKIPIQLIKLAKICEKELGLNADIVFNACIDCHTKWMFYGVTANIRRAIDFNIDLDIVEMLNYNGYANWKTVAKFIYTGDRDDIDRNIKYLKRKGIENLPPVVTHITKDQRKQLWLFYQPNRLTEKQEFIAGIGGIERIK